MFAITQTEYYMTLLKYVALTTGGIIGTVLFLGMVYLIVFYSHYWR